MTGVLPTFRFAPSPNGYLHLGHAYSALLNWRLAKGSGGRFLVRIEDIDTARCSSALTAACLEDLAWLGLEWEQPTRLQSRHLNDYAAALIQMKDRGLVYPCFCTRREVAAASVAADPDGAPLYAGACRRLPASEALRLIDAGVPHNWRLALNEALHAIGSRPLSYNRFVPFADEEEVVPVRPHLWGDAVIARKDIGTSYHLSVVIDDALQGVTHIVRGQDLELATDLHRLLQAILGLPTPLYHHHSLLRTPDGDKLAKRKGHEAIRDLRKRGLSAADIGLRIEQSLRVDLIP